MFIYMELGVLDKPEYTNVQGDGELKEFFSEDELDSIVDAVLLTEKEKGSYRERIKGKDFTITYVVDKDMGVVKIAVVEYTSFENLGDQDRENLYKDVGGRISFKKDIDELLDSGGYFQLYMLGIENYKSISEVYGDDGVLEMVKSIIERVLDYVVGNYTLYTVEDDVIAVLKEGKYDEGFIHRILDLLEESVSVFDKKVYPGVGIGYYVYDGEEVNGEVLMEYGVVALNHAREKGKGMSVRYEERLRHDSFKELQLETEIRDALMNDEFTLLYQPQFSSEKKKSIGAEALIRWNHPRDGFLTPNYFIDMAEKSSLIVRIGEWVVEEVCRQQKEWLDKGYHVMPIAVNIGSLHFKKSTFVEDIKATLDKYKLDADKIALEITESSVINDEVGMISKLTRLNKMGIKVSMDDFGTGYSSLSYLKKFPIDTLKIDKSFVQDIHKDKDNSAIVQAIISLAKTMDLKVIAEGVETDEAVALLNSFDCHDMQGYIFSKPVGKREMERLMDKGFLINDYEKEYGVK